MIVNPNECPATGNLKDASGKKPRWKKILLIVLVSFAASWLMSVIPAAV